MHGTKYAHQLRGKKANPAYEEANIIHAHLLQIQFYC